MQHTSTVRNPDAIGTFFASEHIILMFALTKEKFDFYPIPVHLIGTSAFRLAIGCFKLHNNYIPIYESDSCIVDIFENIDDVKE